jgi:hypothetical protein
MDIQNKQHPSFSSSTDRPAGHKHSLILPVGC